MPTLYLPAGRPVRFVETSKDVIHSFWVIDFLFKRDVIPGRVNQFEVTPTRPGTYVGRCAELCGVYHDRMNFQTVILPAAQFDQKMAQMKATGLYRTDTDAGANAFGDQDNTNSDTPNATYNSDPTGVKSETNGSLPK